MNGKWFSRFSSYLSTMTGRPTTFVVAVGLVVAWGLTGPLFHFSDTWQLVINTSTTIVTFLMVFLIQNTQNRDSIAMQIKLDELIRALRGAHNTVVSLEDADELELLAVKKRYDELAARARGRGGPDTGSPELEAEVADAERAAKHRLRKPDDSRD
jgi:low affinity Fe/Cu permease